MSDVEKWWATPPEQMDLLHRNRAAFVEMFGDFPSEEVALLWIGPSPDGKHVGIYFEKRDGTKIRAAVAHDLTEALLGQMMMALEACAERTFAAAPPAGEA